MNAVRNLTWPRRKRPDVAQDAEICPKCLSVHDRNGSYCRACHAAYMREWRKQFVLVRRTDVSRETKSLREKDDA